VPDLLEVPPVDLLSGPLGGRVVLLTGAGLSTDSGIPDYRGPGAPVRRPMTFQDFVGHGDNQRHYWARAHLGWSRMGSAEPNDGHRALTRLETAGRVSYLITQNVDGLHERAGTRQVLRLHGSIWCVRCVKSCVHGTSREVRDVPSVPLPPRCVCGALLRPDVVWFGEALDPAVLSAAETAAASAEVLLVIGTSSQVYPAAGLIPHARAGGALVVEINPEPSAANVDVRLTLPADEALSRLDHTITRGA
jgi:NAD-dependent SIR2 family protein deacetylase